jgi:hypothetical protein
MRLGPVKMDNLQDVVIASCLSLAGIGFISYKLLNKLADSIERKAIDRFSDI